MIFLSINGICIIFFYIFATSYIRIDEKGNVYINPSKADKPTLLRISENNIPNDIEDFKKYKDNWYIRK